MNDFIVEDTFNQQEDEFAPPVKGVGEQEAAELSGLAVAGTRSDNPAAAYADSKKQLMETGESSLLQGLVASAAQEEQAAKEKSLEAILLDPSISDDEKSSALFNYQEELKQEVVVPDIQAAIMDRLIASDERTLAEETILKMYDSEQQTYGLFEEAIKELGGDIGLADIGGTMLPFNEAKTLAQVIGDTFPEETNVLQRLGSAAAVGEGKEFIVELFRNTDRSEWPEKARLLVDSVRENSGYFGSNSAIAAGVLQTVLEKLSNKVETEDVDALEVVDNVFSILDASLAGSLLKNSVKGAGKLAKGSLASRTATANPKASKQFSAAAIADDEVAKAAGTASEDVALRTMLPKFEQYELEGIETGVRDALEDNLKIAATAVDDTIRHIDEIAPVTPEDSIRLAEEARKKLDKTVGVKFSGENSTVQPTEDGYKATFVYTKGEDELFDSQAEAIAAVSEKFPGAKVRLREIDKSNRGVNTGDATTDKGWMAEITYEHKASEFDKLIFGDRDVLYKNNLLDWITDPASKFARWISAMGERAVDTEALRKQKLFSIADPFLKLGNTSKGKVANVLAEGDHTGRVFSVKELQLKDLTPREIEGYFSVRRLEDSMHMLKDYTLARELRGNGFKWMENNGQKYAVKPKSRETADNLNEVLDPSTGEIVKLSKEQLDDLYGNGGGVVELDTAWTVGNRRVSHAIMDSRKGTTIGEVPETGVLNKLTGHVSRHYKDRYFVREVRDGFVDGVYKKNAIVRVVETSTTKKGAQDQAARLSASAEDGVRYEMAHDRGLGRSERLDLEKQADRASGVLKYAARGERLRHGSELAALENPVESIRRSVDSVARTVTVERVTSSLKNRFINTYHDLLSDGRYPVSTKAIRNTADATDPRVGEARNMWRYINMLDGTPSDFDDSYKLFWIRMGEYLEGRGRGFEYVGGKLKDFGEFNPIGAARSLAFRLFIVGNPIRQAFLQAQQVLFLTGLEPKYILNPNGLAREQSGMLLAAIAADSPAKLSSFIWKQAAAALGTDVQGAKKILKSFEDSGLPYTIDINTLARDAMRQTAKELETTALQKGYNYAAFIPSQVMNAVRRVGFDFGEWNNLSMSWLVAKQRYLRKNPNADISDLKVIEEMAADARGMALSMTKAGEFRYQKGLLSVPLQFLSVQHKAMLAMLTNKTFTGAERARIAIGQLALWGSTGVGVREIYAKVRDHFGLEPNETVDNLILGGIGEVAFDTAMSQLFDEKVDTNIAGSFAAGGGLPNSVANMLVGVFTDQKSMMEMLGGPAYSAGNRILDAGWGVYATFFGREDLDTSEKAVKATEQFVSAFSGASNFFKLQAYKNLGAYVDNYGNPMLDASYADLVLKATIGVDPQAVEDYYRIRNTPNKFNDVIGEEASRILTYFKKDILSRVEPQIYNSGDKDVDLALQRTNMLSKLLEKHDDMVRMVMNLYDEDTALALQSKISSMIMDEWTTTRSDSLLQKLTNLATTGTSGKPLEDLYIQLRNSKLPNKQQYLDAIESAMAPVEYAKEEMK